LGGRLSRSHDRGLGSEAEEWRTRLAHYEGLHVGYSAAANVCAASRLLASDRLQRDAVVATVLCDTGLKY
jgi:cysteine synthase